MAATGGVDWGGLGWGLGGKLGDLAWHGVCFWSEATHKQESLMQHQDISRIIEQAKQQRAEHIGSAIRNHPVATLLVVGLPVLLTQLPWTRSAPVAEALQSVMTLFS